MKIKIIVGYRRDQEHSIDAEEAHKAYYLFLNPEKRGVFNNGLAICGQQIQEIVPDWAGTMGWNPAHNLQPEDWNEIRYAGVEVKMRNMLMAAKSIAQISDKVDMSLPLSQLSPSCYPQPEILGGSKNGTMKALNGK